VPQLASTKTRLVLIKSTEIERVILTSVALVERHSGLTLHKMVAASHKFS